MTDPVQIKRDLATKIALFCAKHSYHDIWKFKTYLYECEAKNGYKLDGGRCLWMFSAQYLNAAYIWYLL